MTNAVSQVTELATENNGVRKYKSLKRPNSNFPSNKPENNGARKYKRPNSIFPPTQQRTMEYERYESLRRPNSSCPPRLSLLFKTKLQVFFKQNRQRPRRPKYLETFRLHGILLHIRKKHTVRKRSSDIWRGMQCILCIIKRKPSLISTNYPFKTRQLKHVLLNGERLAESLEETHVIRTWETFCVKGESGRAC